MAPREWEPNGYARIAIQRSDGWVVQEELARITDKRVRTLLYLFERERGKNITPHRQYLKSRVLMAYRHHKATEWTTLVASVAEIRRWYA